MYQKYNNVERVKPSGLELKDHLVGVNRVTKVTKGGRAFGFSAIVVVGDGNGVVGHGLGKSKDVASAIAKAIEDAKINSQINNINNTVFYAGDMKDVLNTDFINQNGKPDVVITDPPRAGMHPDVVERLMEMEASKIVYVSCNAATQARDLIRLKEKYDVVRIKPVDMFPHTQHVENIVLLKLKG